jgi:23S rRNA pseudouridine2605 synthase
MSKLIVSLSPHAHGNDTVERNMYGVIIALLPALLVSFLYFGLGSAIVCATSVAACIFFEWAINTYILKNERNTVLDIVRNACQERIYPVGRLDRNTTGVLLLTNDGDLAAKLTHPKFEKKKVYAATLDRELTEEDEQTLRNGVVLDDGKVVPDALEFPKGDRLHIGLEIHSGQNRVVRRMFEKVGYHVEQLDRVSFAGLTKKNVPRGKWRFLTPKEVSMLQMGAF